MTEPWKWSFLRFTWQWNRTISASVIKSVKWSSCVISPNPSHCRQHARYMSASFHLKFGKLDLLSGVVACFVFWQWEKIMRRDSRQIGGSWTCTWLESIAYSGVKDGYDGEWVSFWFCQGFGKPRSKIIVVPSSRKWKRSKQNSLKFLRISFRFDSKRFQTQS